MADEGEAGIRQAKGKAKNRLPVIKLLSNHGEAGPFPGPPNDPAPLADAIGDRTEKYAVINIKSFAHDKKDKALPKRNKAVFSFPPWEAPQLPGTPCRPATMSWFRSTGLGDRYVL
jgi:hypothetical protein